MVESHNADMTSTAGGTPITEGIGINRLTANFAAATVDAAFRGTNQEALDMAYYLLRYVSVACVLSISLGVVMLSSPHAPRPQTCSREGLFVGPSAALNVAGAVKAARLLGPGHTIVTVLCDGGERYRSKIYSPAWLAERGLAVGVTDFGRDHADFVQ